MGIECCISKFQFIANQFIFVFIVEADFTEIWKQFILADIRPPGRKVFATLGLTEIAVSDFQSPVDSGNHLVGRFHLVYNPFCISLMIPSVMRKLMNASLNSGLMGQNLNLRRRA